jgi:hypothetical protein
LITLWFPRFLRKCEDFSDSIESTVAIFSITNLSHCNRSLVPSINFYALKNLKILDVRGLDEFFDHMTTRYPAYVAWLSSQQQSAKETEKSGRKNLLDSVWTPESIVPADFLDLLDKESVVESERNQGFIESDVAVCAVSSEILSVDL